MLNSKNLYKIADQIENDIDPDIIDRADKIVPDMQMNIAFKIKCMAGLIEETERNWNGD